MRAVDTNVLVRLITRDQPNQLTAAKDFVHQGAWVSHVVLVETAWVLESVYDLQPKAIATAIAMLLDHRELAVQDAQLATAALQLFRRHPDIGFSDCLILETARYAGHVPLGTFDRDLGKLEGAHRL